MALPFVEAIPVVSSDYEPETVAGMLGGELPEGVDGVGRTRHRQLYVTRFQRGEGTAGDTQHLHPQVVVNQRVRILLEGIER